jgi:hypothetical protein
VPFHVVKDWLICGILPLISFFFLFSSASWGLDLVEFKWWSIKDWLICGILPLMNVFIQKREIPSIEEVYYIYRVSSFLILLY